MLFYPEKGEGKTDRRRQECEVSNSTLAVVHACISILEGFYFNWKRRGGEVHLN